MSGWASKNARYRLQGVQCHALPLLGTSRLYRDDGKENGNYYLGFRVLASRALFFFSLEGRESFWGGFLNGVYGEHSFPILISLSLNITFIKPCKFNFYRARKPTLGNLGTLGIDWDRARVIGHRRLHARYQRDFLGQLQFHFLQARP